MRTIILKLSGPLQSYGTNGFGNFRYTDNIPSKSAVIGMMAAALGYRRDEEEKLQELLSLHFAVRVDRKGIKTRDYQTIYTCSEKKTKKQGKPDIDEHTYITHRYYMEDALYMAAIGSDDKALMKRIETALKQCVYTPVLGRRSCPVLYDWMFAATDEDPVTALTNLPWQGKRGMYQSDTITLPIYADACLLTECVSYPRHDIQESFTSHTMGYRSEAKSNVDVPVIRTPEDDILTWDYSQSAGN